MKSSLSNQNTQVKTLLIFGIMISIVLSQNLTTQFIKFCNNKTISIITDQNQLKLERSKLIGIQVLSSDFAGIISNGDVKPLFKSKFGVFLMIIL